MFRIPSSAFLLAALILCSIPELAYADPTSSGDQDLVNQTATTFYLTAVTHSANATTSPSEGNTLNPTMLPGNTDKNTINVSGPWRQNISLTFSYRDAGGTYGCDFQVYLAYTGNAGADNYYINYYAYAVNPGSTLVQCKAETGSSETVYGTGARINGVYFIKSP